MENFSIDSFFEFSLLLYEDWNTALEQLKFTIRSVNDGTFQICGDPSDSAPSFPYSWFPMTHTLKHYTEKTISAWDEVAARHLEANPNWLLSVASTDFNNLNVDFNKLVDRYNMTGKSVVQVCCNNGLDLLSIKRKGASRCLGIDGSRNFIEQGELLRDIAGVELEFCCADIYELPQNFNGTFEIVVVTVGVFGWMPDIAKFFDVCARLLCPGGHLLIEEIHPILGMYEQGSPSYIGNSYFYKDPHIEDSGLDYFTQQKYKSKECFWFHHSLSEILMAAVNARLVLEHFAELNYNIGNYCADLEFSDANPPLGMNLAWRKDE